VNKAIGTKNDGTENIQTDTPGQRQLVIVDRSGLWKGKPVKTLTEGLTKRAAATTRPQTSYAAVVVTSAPIAWSISSVARGRSARSSASNTIRTGPHSLR
jgi:hypothetical protein